ncbi:E3 ubiquitin/ISG15 ligase TRIM25-like [Bombina bombina]|uniref:E3 ubiquitin/ISG15 ligase TRIM25-like n=1 Tax=Bombina bombina TaxID=8345 RepID=UPI00235AFD93|nr:E3 ubiquitin/ISG15 ligase TRIM25-like [Bombina bombina]
MASADLREELTCQICRSIYTDPVTLICGHNFCLDYIESVLGTQEGSGVYSCPDCRKSFSNRPELQINITLCNIVRHLHSTQPEQNETGILCTYCVHSPVPAVKSCLLCEASLCDAHLRVHSKSEEHILTEPTTSWGNRKCPKHKKLLEYYCTEDAACICVTCSLAGEHRGHQVELLNEASEKKKEKLRDVLQKLTTKREEAEKSIQSQQLHSNGVQEKVAGLTKRLTALIKEIKKHLEDLEKQALSEITQKEEQVLLTVSELIQQLEKEKGELTRKICHIEELCNMTDPLTVLQEQESHRDDFCGAEKGDTEVTQTDDKQVPAGSDLDEGLILETLYSALADIVTDVMRQLYVQVTSEELLDVNTAANNENVSSGPNMVSCSDINQQQPETRERFIDTRSLCRNLATSVTAVNEKAGLHVKVTSDLFLDTNTAANTVTVSDDLRTVSWSRIDQQRPESPERFTIGPQVLGTKSFSSGRHYWEVQTSQSGDWSVGVCYPSMRRGGWLSIGFNNMSWCLCGWRNGLSVRHRKMPTSVHPLSCDRVGILLDYEAGCLTFYELCDPIRHLYTFTCTFTEPLHAVFYVWGDGAWVRIIS